MSEPTTQTAPQQPASRRSLAVRGGLWSAASQLIPAFGTAALSVAAGRYLGSAALGEQSLIAYLNAAAAAVIVNALNTALLQVGGRLQGQGGDAGTFRLLMRWCIRAHVASGVLVLAVMIVSGLLVGNNHLAWAVIGVVSVLDAVADGLAVRLVLTEGWAPMGKLRLIFQFLGPPLGLVFLFAGFGIAGIFFGDGLAALGLLIAVLARYRRTGRLDPAALYVRATAPDELHARPPVPVARSFGLFAVSALITQVVSKRVEFVVLALFASDTAVGMYSVAFMAVNLLAMIPLGIAGAAMPIVAAAEGRGELDVATRHLRLALRMGTLISVPLTAILAAVGPSAVTLVYGSEYGPAARLVPLASTALLVAVVTGVCSQFWSGQGKLGIVLGTGALAAMADLAVAFSLVPWLDALGAVIANLSGQLALAVGLVYATVRKTGAIGWRLAGLRSALIAGLAGVAAALAVRYLTDSLMPTGVELRAGLALVLGSAVGAVVIVVVSTRLKLFDAEEAQWVRPMVPSRLTSVLDRMSEKEVLDV